MPSFYSIVQYVPDAISDERINIGVIVYEQERWRSRFLQNWTRVNCFGSRDTGFLKKFADDVSLALSEDIPSQEKTWHLNDQELRRISSHWVNAIQVTEPRGSLLPLDQLFSYIYGRFIIDPQPRQRTARTRTQAASGVFKTVKDVVTVTFGKEPRKIVKWGPKISGRSDAHRIDIGVGTDIYRIGALAMSFEGPDSNERKDECQLMAWAAEDIRKINSDIVLGAVVLPPHGESEDYQKFLQYFDGLDVTVVPENETRQWAKDSIQATPELAQELAALK